MEYPPTDPDQPVKFASTKIDDTTKSPRQNARLSRPRGVEENGVPIPWTPVTQSQHEDTAFVIVVYMNRSHHIYISESCFLLNTTQKCLPINYQCSYPLFLAADTPQYGRHTLLRQSLKNRHSFYVQGLFFVLPLQTMPQWTSFYIGALFTVA